LTAIAPLNSALTEESFYPAPVVFSVPPIFWVGFPNLPTLLPNFPSTVPIFPGVFPILGRAFPNFPTVFPIFSVALPIFRRGFPHFPVAFPNVFAAVPIAGWGFSPHFGQINHFYPQKSADIAEFRKRWARIGVGRRFP